MVQLEYTAFQHWECMGLTWVPFLPSSHFDHADHADQADSRPKIKSIMGQSGSELTLGWAESSVSARPTRGKTSQNSTNTYTYHYTTPQIHVDLAWHCQIGVGRLHSSNKYTCSHDVSLPTNKTLCTKTTGDVYLQSSNLDIDINQR